MLLIYIIGYIIFFLISFAILKFGLDEPEPVFKSLFIASFSWFGIVMALAIALGITLKELYLCIK